MVRMLALSFAWVLLAIGAGFVLLHAIPELQLVYRKVTLLATFIPVGIVAWVLAFFLFLAAGRGWGKALAVIALAGLVMQLFWAAPYFPTKNIAASRSGTSLFTLNSRCESSWQQELTAVLQETEPDILVLQGATENMRSHLQETGTLEPYPHQEFFPMEGLTTCGTAVYSTLPTAKTTTSTATRPAVRVSASSGDFVLIPTDMPNPQKGLAAWTAAMEEIGQAAVDYTTQEIPVVLAGDFNATREHLPYRKLTEQSPGFWPREQSDAATPNLINAADLAGTGWQPTYRDDRWFPALIEIDHVLVSPNVRVNALERVSVHGYAHVALLAWLEVEQNID